MWPWRRKGMPAQEDVPPDEPEDAEDRRSEERKRRLRRRAGCVWGCLTEPIVLGGLTLLAVVFGRAYLVRRAQRMREQEQAEEDNGNVSA